jgi:hypothetical protein
MERSMNRGRRPDSLLQLHEQLMDARRPLLFSRMPRMLRDDGRTVDALRNEFRAVENNAEVTPAAPVSPARWKRALATSRRLSLRRRTSRGG